MSSFDAIGRSEPTSAQPVPDASRRPARLVIDPWRSMQTQLAALLSREERDDEWLQRLHAVAARIRELIEEHPDAALYLMQQNATHEVEQYSSHHAMYCAVISQLCSSFLDLPNGEREALLHAALTMNVAMTRLQDAMAKHAGGLADSDRERIANHPRDGANLLRDAGVTDSLWLDTVERHHAPVRDSEPAEYEPPAQRLAQLLQRIDVYTAKLSCRKARSGTSAMTASRHALLDRLGRPDAIGQLLLKVLGLYPPGSFVRLANGDQGVVVQRGAKAHTPIVVSLRRADGGVIVQPQRHDTADRRYVVTRGLLWSDVKVLHSHEKVLGAT